METIDSCKIEKSILGLMIGKAWKKGIPKRKQSLS